MAIKLKKCKRCGNIILKNVDICPYCGKDNSNDMAYVWGGVAFVFVIMLIGGYFFHPTESDDNYMSDASKLSSIMQEKMEDKNVDEKFIETTEMIKETETSIEINKIDDFSEVYKKITIEDINDSLRANIARARDEYVNHNFEVEGIITKISENMDYIKLGDSEFDLYGAECFMVDDLIRDYFYNSNVNNSVKIRGVCVSVGDEYIGKECRFIIFDVYDGEKWIAKDKYETVKIKELNGKMDGADFKVKDGGRRVCITAKISEITDLRGNAFSDTLLYRVHLKNNEEVQLDCVDEDNYNKIKNYKKGDKITINGIVDSNIMGYRSAMNYEYKYGQISILVVDIIE